MNEPNSDLKNAYRISLVIGAAMVASVVMYAVIVEIMKRQVDFTGNPPPAETANLLRYIFLGVSGMEIFAIIFLRRAMLGGKLGPRNSPEKIEGFKGLADSGILSQVGWQRKRIHFPPGFLPLAANTIITYALCESVAIFGLTLFFISHKASDFYMFLAASLLMFAVFFPRYSQWEALVKQREMDEMMSQGKV